MTWDGGAMGIPPMLYMLVPSLYIMAYSKLIYHTFQIDFAITFDTKAKAEHCDAD